MSGCVDDIRNTYLREHGLSVHGKTCPGGDVSLVCVCVDDISALNLKREKVVDVLQCRHGQPYAQLSTAAELISSRGWHCR